MSYIIVWVLTMVLLAASHQVIDYPCHTDTVFTGVVLAWAFVMHSVCLKRNKG